MVFKAGKGILDILVSLELSTYTLIGYQEWHKRELNLLWMDTPNKYRFCLCMCVCCRDPCIKVYTKARAILFCNTFGHHEVMVAKWSFSFSPLIQSYQFCLKIIQDFFFLGHSAHCWYISISVVRFTLQYTVLFIALLWNTWK